MLDMRFHLISSLLDFVNPSNTSSDGGVRGNIKNSEVGGLGDARGSKIFEEGLAR